MAATQSSIRDSLFGDLPLEEWPSQSFLDSLHEPWITFAAARQMLASGQKDEAIGLWRGIAAMPGLESRHYAQAWHFLRSRGVPPPAEIAKTLLGVIVEVGMNDGQDLLAAYPDHTARYFNFRGRGVVWEHPDGSLDALIDDVLSAAKPILQAIAPWPDSRPAPPAAGLVRINLLSPAGLHFGQGPMNALASDPFARPAFDAATALMLRLIRCAKQAKPPEQQR